VRRGCDGAEQAMKISKRTREQAAMLCAIAASAPPVSMTDVCYSLDPAKEAAELAYAAWQHAYRHMSIVDPRWYIDGGWYLYAEAESLLRTGWSPP
jgi:hypothetical protein